MLVVRQGTSCRPRHQEEAARLLAVLTEEQKEELRGLLFDWAVFRGHSRKLAKDIVEGLGFDRSCVRGLYDLKEGEHAQDPQP